TEIIIAREGSPFGSHTAIVLMHPFTSGDGLGGKTDDLTELSYWRAFGDGLDGEFVPPGDALRSDNPRQNLCLGLHIIEHHRHVVAGAQDESGMILGFIHVCLYSTVRSARQRN